MDPDCVISISPEPKYRWRVTFPNSRVNPIDFGEIGVSTYIDHQDRDKLFAYVTANQYRCDEWTCKTRPAFWERWVLWNKPTIVDAVKDIGEYYNLKIVIRISSTPETSSSSSYRRWSSSSVPEFDVADMFDDMYFGTPYVPAMLYPGVNLEPPRPRVPGARRALDFSVSSPIPNMWNSY